ncbi:bifunctional endoribonuclease/protein kinase ire1 [Tulasnella sp. 424]|nr:bifunctional endoribonuclease/protein kinase ire1 [Tulasnella sp. 424]KAG8974869.1 bifunctional endoribonuclease/protein kinase ire1 [Tulasnella sp. 425]
MASSLVAAYFLPLILFYIWSARSQPSANNAATSITALQRFTASQQPPRVSFRDSSLEADELKLMDVVLLASVDGRFHALNRTTGRMLWSMDQPIANPQVAVTNLKELVLTQHGGLRTTNEFSLDDFDDDPAITETYIIEPQSGAIFVSPADSKREDPLQRLPFTMQQLVDMSPLRIDHRTFVGKKRTSLITLDLASGELVEVLDPEQQCSWGDQPTRKRFFQSKDEDLLDELDPPGADRALVHIGRTEYHVSVYSHDQVIQNLTYSSYGPNNVDKELQYHWRRTPDNLYHQPTPDGSLLMFKIDEKEPFRSFIKLKRPIVAVFDAVSIADRTDPLILAQPTPALSDLYPSRLKELRELSKQDEVTYVGRVGNSLYALSHNTFPLVIFSQLPSLPTIDSEHGESREILDTDDLGTPLQQVCTTLDCLTGPHRTETATMSRLSRLIAGSESTDPGRSSVVPRFDDDDFEEEDRPTSSSPPVVITTPRQSNPPYPALDPPRTGDQLGRWTIGGADLKSPIFTGLFGLIFLAWVFAKRVTETWRRSQGSLEVFQRDMGHEKPVFPRSRPASFIQAPAPTPEEVVQAVVPPEVIESKPLPPVPVPDPPIVDLGEEGDKSVIVEEPEGDDNGDDAETEKEVEDTKGGKKKGPKRRKRGKGGKKVTIAEPVKEDTGDSEPPELNSNIVITPSSNANPAPASSLTVSETVLGYGSHGTVVFQGSFQGRAVAVKRLLQHCVTLATREVNILQESDDHPNVIRYYFKENKDNFLYIALELCPASLADIIEAPHKHPEISATFDPKRALMQVTNGLKHLHSLKIVHRDIKPQNILISRPNNSGSNGRSLASPQHRMLISDFGLCRKLESDQTSFLPTNHSGGGMAAGTVGWRAPEILRGEVKLDEPTLDLSSGGTPNSSVGGNGSGYGNGLSRPGVTRLTKSVDVFALGCLFYYTLTSGEHPYGERFEREVNILKNVRNLDRLEPLGEEGTEAGDLITRMLDPDPKDRPDMTSCLIHPFFWTPARRLGFLQDASDRFEIMCREPREPQLVALETGAPDVVGSDWHKKLDKLFDDNLGKFRKYDGKSVQDLLRALRNKKHHYQDIPDNVKRAIGGLPEGFLSYFTKRFPRLFLHVYGVVAADPILRNDAMFRSYFDSGGD